MAQDILLGARMRVEETLSERRAHHVFAVDREMHALCREFGLGEEEEKSLSLIALLHDITKEKDTQTQLKMCLEYGIILSDADRAVEKGLHAITGAALAKAEYGLREELVSALRYHTTGRANMGFFEQLLFLADYIEDTRTYPPCIALRKYFWENVKKAEGAEDKKRVLARAVRLGLDCTLQDLVEEERFMHPDTVEARNWFLSLE